MIKNLAQIISAYQDRLKIVETNIPSLTIVKKTSRWKPIVAVIASLAGLAAIITCGFYIKDRYFYTPVHQKIVWTAYHPDVDAGKPVKNEGWSIVKEGSIQTTLLPIMNTFGECVVYKENNQLTLQASFENTKRVTSQDRIGDRVTEGCSEATIRSYSLSCCWVD